MSGPHSTPAEHHLGDRLAALVDGELGHDARERVLAHLATCARCKAEADAQRRLKNVFAEAAPPPPSESFLARLQGLPGGDDDEGDPFGGGGLSGGGVFSLTGRLTPNPLRGRPRNPFSMDAPETPAPGLPDGEHGFRIHEVGRQDAERAASRGRRFAFAAAGAVSLAAIALGGVTAGVPTAAGSGGQGGGGTPSNATPLSSAGPVNSAEAGRRRSTTQPAARSSERPVGDLPLSAPIVASAPLLPGVPSPPHPEPKSPLSQLSTVSPLMQTLPTAPGASETTSPAGAPNPPTELLGQAPKAGPIRMVR
ncbi:anti-sigma factor [Streptomyces sp. TS71-3]|uniref:anti-sigma factor family protein n=1 Tax=Streptomyces sp. TS71-3 TaxID=2733862 RepID=UPI001B08BBC5|nr:zf-HC2 domain-containing protein [Streptomyces sp. TS71-3]GHJ35793.1 membrane protein [Streptomyces sp. TS71-3]